MVSTVPTSDQFERVADAFSRKAQFYDRFGEGHEQLTRMRTKVYEHVFSFAPPAAHAHMLEINAGTGADATFFAQQGMRVHATDISPGMLAEIEAKIERFDLHDRLTSQRCSFTELDKIDCGSFDYVFSNFGGLNCIADLGDVTRHLPALLKPGGMVTWVIMPPVCPWELARVLRGDFITARRRLARNGIRANVAGVTFTTYYFTPREVRDAFGSDFHQRRLEGLAIVTPTADNKRFARRFPRLYRWLCALDDRLATVPPFNGWGDFFILTMQYVP